MKEQFITGIKRALNGLVPEKRLSTLTEETHLRELGVDSIDMLRLVTHLEDVFQTTFSDDELIPENFRTVGSLFALLDGKKVEVKSE